MATHTGIDLYSCAYCEASFKSKSNRYTHYRRHHPAEYNATIVKRDLPKAISSYEMVTAASVSNQNTIVNQMESLNQAEIG